MKSVSLLICALFIFSCSSRSKITKAHLIEGSCDKEFKKAEFSEGQNIWANIEETTGTGGSYLITSIGYSTDILVTFGGGVIGTVAICSPFIIADGLSKSGGAFSQGCVNSVSPKIFKNLNPGLGPKGHEATVKWRCPDVDPVAEGLMKVAECYRRNDEKDLADKQIQELKNSDILNRCLSNEIKRKVSEL